MRDIHSTGCRPGAGITRIPRTERMIIDTAGNHGQSPDSMPAACFVHRPSYIVDSVDVYIVESLK
jgi:hypothetical protein